MANIEERVGRDGKTSYRALIRKKGHPPQSATFKRKTDAKKWATSTEAAIEEKRYHNFTQAKRHTVSELIDAYIADYLPQKANGGGSQKQQLEWWREQIGTLTLADLTSSVINEHRNKLATRKGPKGDSISPATVNRYLAALSHVLTVAVNKLEWMPDTPMRRVSNLKEPRGRERFLSPEERDRLLEACEKSPAPFLLPMVVLAISTGMRRGEIRGLTWNDVDFEHQRMILRNTKNGETRAVPLVGLAQGLLRQHKEDAKSDSPFVFPGRNPGKPFDPRKAWTNALKEAEIENFKFHDLRHTAASYLAMNGATLNEIAEVLGHKTLAMVQRYVHLTKSHTSSVVESMNKKVFGDDQ